VLKGRIKELETRLAWYEENSKKQQEYIEVQKRRIMELENIIIAQEALLERQEKEIIELKDALL
jgi:hypothetical protein